MSAETLKALMDAIDAHIADTVDTEVDVVVTDWALAVELSGLVNVEDETARRSRSWAAPILRCSTRRGA